MTRKDVMLVFSGLIILVFLGVIFALLGLSSAQKKSNSVEETRQNLPALDSAKPSAESVKQQPVSTEKAQDGENPSASSAIRDRVEVKQVGDISEGKFAILKNGKAAANLNLGAYSTARVKKMVGKNVYIEADTSNGRGGYYLYSGGDSLYKFDIETNQLAKVIADAYFISDISPDEKFLLLCRGNSVQLKSMKDGSVVKSFPVSEKFGQSGDAYFFDGGTKLVYEAAISNLDDEKFSMFTIDIASGKQETIMEDKPFKPNSAAYALMRP